MGFWSTVGGHASTAWGATKTVAGKVPGAWNATTTFAEDAAFNWKYSGTREVLGKGFNGAKKLTGKAGLIALGAGALVALPFVISGTRNKRRYRDMDTPAPADMALPPVMGAALPETAMAGPAQAMPATEAGAIEPQETLLGEPLVKNGPKAQQILAERGGLAGGINPNSPSITGADGRNVIDGAPLQFMGR